MSVTQELGKVQAELKAAGLQIEQLEGAAVTSQETIDKQAAQIADLEGQVATMQETIDGHEAAQAEAHKELSEQLASAQGQVETLTAEKGELEKKIANPAYEMAGAKGEDVEAAGGGGEGGAQGGTLMEQYKAIKDPAERAAFLAQNQAALVKEG